MQVLCHLTLLLLDVVKENSLFMAQFENSSITR